MRLSRHIDTSDTSFPNQRELPFFQKMTLLRICAVFLIFSAALTFVKLSNTQKAHAAGWTQIFNEDFNGAGGSGLNTAN